MQRRDSLLLLYPLCFVNGMSLAHWALACANLARPLTLAGHFQSQGPSLEGRYTGSTCQVSRFKVRTHLPQPLSTATPFIHFSLWVEWRHSPRVTLIPWRIEWRHGPRVTLLSFDGAAATALSPRVNWWLLPPRVPRAACVFGEEPVP